MSNSIVGALVKPLTGRKSMPAEIILVVLGSLFVGAMSQVSIPLPFTPIPITGQTFAVLLIGLTYGRSLAVYTIALYLVEGISGLPVFAGGTSGFGVLLGTTGGYLIGFIFAAAVVAQLVEWGMGKSTWLVFLSSILGSLVIYVFGVIGLMRFIDFSKAMTLGVYPFLVGDLIKAILAATAVPAVWNLIEKAKEKN